ncbi:hypothetical protein BABINDRAFT_159651 [Babjeviella inositovora NRRL Y-12698]|uniref:DNA polymerase n=1 Tax=Babjeviella inositovora NRRL Y-12698 TaxID=984486 RepID=A0A1E3QZU9_9ASCO|nr:uncharacterized protein BABINDRAFT_159651 [Babjeviella inositovora NRRL Y-12698]ODQ83210.1 hypothetical protein BABINDRAFT_159651 [Babjeviella inositovora NRRL Y-12698]
MGSKSDKFSAFRAARAAGTSRMAEPDSDVEDANIYDEVDEDTYRKHKRDELLKDDFIVEDDGQGYVDTGADEWDARTRPKYDSDSEHESDSAKPAKKRKVKKSAQISHFFKPTMEAAAPKKLDAKVDDILDDLFAGSPVAKRARAPFAARAPRDVFSAKPAMPRFGSVKTEVDVFGDIDLPTKPEDIKSDVEIDMKPEADSSFDMNSSPTRQPGRENTLLIKENTLLIKEESSDEEVVVKRRPTAVKVKRDANVSAVKETPKKSAYVPATEQFTSPAQPTDKLDEAAIAIDGAFRMYWLDYAEVDNSLLLFGKILTLTGEMVSGVVQLTGMNRELYFLPREHRRSDDAPVSAMDVHEEIVPLLIQKFGLQNVRAKPQTMKYAFELPGIPAEAEYLKILLPYQTPRARGVTLPGDLEGDTFQHVFGGSTSIFEAFVVQKNVMGPCWLQFSNGDFSTIQNTSHCRVEVLVDGAANVSVCDDKTLATPRLTCTSISVQTVMNAQTNRQEVTSVSLATFRDIAPDAPIDANAHAQGVVTLVRPVGATLPPGLTTLSSKQDFSVRTFNNEKTLLNCLCGLIKQADPDVFIGHRLENISLDVLVHRMYDLKVVTWSAFGRRNRKLWPERFHGRLNSGLSMQLREIFQGRLLCDIANEMGQSLTMKCQSWDLQEMYSVVCDKKFAPLEINYNNPQYADDSSMLLMALRENASVARIAADIAFAMQILSLSKQLTNLAGNAWAHTLGGTRAGRNEYILLHEFAREGYVVPDKSNSFARNQAVKPEIPEEDAATVTSNKKPKYQGGLVFEPEKGLHKNHILVMDFNSLYPSIIQEFNICFTTVERGHGSGDEDILPAVPARDAAPGVLPRLLLTLVNRRREVKKLMADARVTPIERAQYDIKQQALKLTANSMYGCLGYVNSRFYAKPLAMLVTNKGREILMDTRQLVESLNLRVVYGDTDSVMIDTGCDNFAAAMVIGNELKTAVNERYRLLEIDIDNIYKRLLLHAKKKYAAVNVAMVNGVEKTSLEVKGLDMKRREYCQLSKEVSTYILEKLLSEADTEDSLREIYAYLETVAADVKGGRVRADKFKINTKLSKDPGDYPGGKNMPAVQVALRLREQGKVVKAGTVITFVITAGDAAASPAERARALTEVLARDSSYTPDPAYYLEKQILSPVERLMGKIEGVDMTRIATSLGLDARRYEMRARAHAGVDALAPLESTVSDAERFRDAAFLPLRCACGARFAFGGIVASRDYVVSFHGIKCAACAAVLPTLRVTAQLERIIRAHISRYYAGWLVCDDSACGIATRQISVYGKRCIGLSGTAHGCKGIMRYRYSDKALYNQLLYLDSIFDIEKAKKGLLKPFEGPEALSHALVEALAVHNAVFFGVCRGVVQKYLSDCGRRYVDMGGLFNFMEK